VDDHAEPLEELARLERVKRRGMDVYRQFVPTRKNPEGCTNHSVIDAAIEDAEDKAETTTHCTLSCNKKASASKRMSPSCANLSRCSKVNCGRGVSPWGATEELFRLDRLFSG